MDGSKESAEGENLSDMETDQSVVQWMMRRKDPEAWFGISWNSEKIDCKKEIIQHANEGTAGEKIYCPSTFLWSSRPQTDPEKIQRELRAATTRRMRIAGPSYREAPD